MLRHLLCRFHSRQEFFRDLMIPAPVPENCTTGIIRISSENLTQTRKIVSKNGSPEKSFGKTPKTKMTENENGNVFQRKNRRPNKKLLKKVLFSMKLSSGFKTTSSVNNDRLAKTISAWTCSNGAGFNCCLGLLYHYQGNSFRSLLVKSWLRGCPLNTSYDMEKAKWIFLMNPVFKDYL